MPDNAKKCLLIDDDLDDQDIFKLALDRAALNVDLHTANSGYDALQMLHTNTSFIPDFIFLDLNMDGMDGKRTLIEIKKIVHLNETQVIIFSTSSYVEDIKETKKLGATAFITKPSLISELVITLNKFLK